MSLIPTENIIITMEDLKRALKTFLDEQYEYHWKEEKINGFLKEYGYNKMAMCVYIRPDIKKIIGKLINEIESE